MCVLPKQANNDKNYMLLSAAQQKPLYWRAACWAS